MYYLYIICLDCLQ